MLGLFLKRTLVANAFSAEARRPNSHCEENTERNPQPHQWLNL